MIIKIGAEFKFITEKGKSIARITEIQDKFIVIEVNGEILKLDKQIFIDKFREYERKKKLELLQKYKNSKDEKKVEIKNECKNCMEYRKGECIGASKICEEFIYSPNLTDEELSRWPKNGQVSRVKSDTFIIKETDNMYNKYNVTYH